MTITRDFFQFRVRDFVTPTSLRWQDDTLGAMPTALSD
jgi:hypothetical protein